MMPWPRSCAANDNPGGAQPVRPSSKKGGCLNGSEKRGPRQGLEVLFAENSIEEEGKTVSLPISEIEPNRAQPRKQFDDEALAELSASISQHGVLQPLLVRPVAGGSYQLVAGERPLAGFPHGRPD